MSTNRFIEEISITKDFVKGRAKAKSSLNKQERFWSPVDMRFPGWTAETSTPRVDSRRLSSNAVRTLQSLLLLYAIKSQ